MSRFRGSLLLLATATITAHARVNVTTTAVCGSSFGWMNNSENQSPCLVVSYLRATCGNGIFKVDALPPGSSYDPPSVGNRTADVCACSWAAYNLFSACTLCQGNPAFNWATYNQGCAGFLSNSTFFPANETIRSETSVPFWAGMNPTIWQDELFNAPQAQAIAYQKHPDYNSTGSIAASGAAPASSKSTSSVGPIVGGVIGGLAALAMGALACFFLYRRRRVNLRETLYSNGGPRHFRILSDTTQMKFGNAVRQLKTAWSDAISPISNYTHLPGGHSLATTQGLPQTITTLQSIEPFAGIVRNPVRKGSAARAAAVGINEICEDHQQHCPVHLVSNPFEQAEQATGTNPPDALDRSTSQPTTGAGSGRGSLALIGILRALEPGS